MTTPTPLATLRLLHREGTLAARFDEVAALLSALGPDDLAAASRLLARTDLGEAAGYHPALPTVSVALTGNGTLEALRTALVGELARHGYLPDVRLTDFGSYVFELGDPDSSLYSRPADFTVCVLDHATVFDEVPVPFTADDVSRVLSEKTALWRRLAEGFAARGGGTLVLNTVPLPRTRQVQLLDHTARARLGVLWRSANSELLALGTEGGPAVTVDIDPLLTTGAVLTEPRFEVYAGAHLADPLLAAYARELAHLVRARTGRAKKVLALDLDGTLWGGVLGDDGVEGIEVADGRQGAAFHAFQGVVRQLQSQGVLLAAVTKNDRATVLDALREHPELRLREEHFVAVLADWQPKPGHLGNLARALNLGEDSLVFVDDNPGECAAVSAQLPDVTVVPVDADPAFHTERLLADGWFTSTGVTQEDRVRTRLYQEESARADFLGAAGSAREFLAGLGVRLELAPVSPAQIPRVAQLTQRTNQFNLTTERLTADEVRARAAEADRSVVVLSAADRFGSNGIVGALFLRANEEAHPGDSGDPAGPGDPVDPGGPGSPGSPGGPGGPVLEIENFLLSCRVFARGIEQASLSAVLGLARRAGFAEVRGTYLPTRKNAKVADLYPHYGFVPREGAGAGRYALGLAGEEALPGVPGHLELDVADSLLPKRP
ncbi:HAD-IIIC family phosphatase [Streptomyces sp. NPDC059452]|uniref:HAD-IIIC family phosphatase n=1 Tax=Streptomyces sp. NPDC059452 TaxID=3346835 RepID=UPI00369C6DE4